MLKKAGLVAAAIGAALMLCAAGVEADEVQDAWDEQVREQRRLEAPVIEQFAGTLSRQGTTLTIVADNGVTKVFEDMHCYCSDAYYSHVIEYISSLESFVVWYSGYEWTGYALVHKPTGATVGLSSVPVPDPSGTRFVAVAPGGYDAPSIQIGILTGSGITMEVDQTIDSNFTVRQWIEPDRIDLACLPESSTCGAFLLRQGEQWHLVASRSTPVPLP